MRINDWRDLIFFCPYKECTYYQTQYVGFLNYEINDNSHLLSCPECKQILYPCQNCLSFISMKKRHHDKYYLCDVCGYANFDWVEDRRMPYISRDILLLIQCSISFETFYENVFKKMASEHQTLCRRFYKKDRGIINKKRRRSMDTSSTFFGGGNETDVSLTDTLTSDDIIQSEKEYVESRKLLLFMLNKANLIHRLEVVFEKHQCIELPSSAIKLLWALTDSKKYEDAVKLLEISLKDVEHCQSNVEIYKDCLQLIENNVTTKCLSHLFRHQFECALYTHDKLISDQIQHLYFIQETIDQNLESLRDDHDEYYIKTVIQSILVVYRYISRSIL